MRVVPWVLAWFLLLALPARAAAPDVDAFVAGVHRWTAEGDLLMVVQAVRLYPEVAAPAFDRVLAGVGSDPADLTWLNPVAHSLQESLDVQAGAGPTGARSRSRIA